MDIVQNNPTESLLQFTPTLTGQEQVKDHLLLFLTKTTIGVDVL